ncbi:histidine kinase [Runella rosea]|nr:histidine kinase [Runella rosea]
MMKKIIYFSIILLLSDLPLTAQEVLLRQLAEARKISNPIVRDSMVLEAIYLLTQSASFDHEKWRDSVRFRCNLKNSELACLMQGIREADKGVNSINGKTSIERLSAIAKRLEARKNLSQAAYAYMRIGAIYNYILSHPNDKKIALGYYQNALQLALKSQSMFEIARAYDYIGEYYLSLKQYDSALKYLKIAEKTQISSPNKAVLPTIYSSISACYINKKDIKKAAYYHSKTEELFNNEVSYQDPSYIQYVKMIYAKAVANFFFKAKNYDETLNHCFKSLEHLNNNGKTYTYRSDFENDRLDFLEIVHKCYLAKSDYKKAYHFLNEYAETKNRVNNIVHTKEISEFNIKYQSEQSKLKISALENENLKKEAEKQSNLGFFLVILLLSLLGLVGYVYYSNIKLRLKNTEISQAMLQGQTIERKRVAADLHDSLGSTMSSLIYTVNAIDTKNLDDQEQNVYLHLKQMLDTAYNEIRLLSHNLLPEEFEKQGLAEALRHFVRKINQTKTIQFDLSIDPQLGRLSPKTEFELYSICLELINNILKHAHATKASISLAHEKNQVKLFIADNGRGFFDNDSDGKGMKNVKARIESLNGTWQYDSKQNIGTSSAISIPI